MSAVEQIDPFSPPKFQISISDKVATAGSCFALHIANALRSAGMNYYVAEPAAPEVDVTEATRRHFGEYSARFGNIYSTVQLNQLFRRSAGTFHPKEQPWILGEAFADPFRPRIEPSGFASVDALLKDRALHLQAVSEMFRQLDVFIFTLGLTESWQCVEDGAVLPVCPGSDVGKFDGAKYAFRNISVSENIAALDDFITLLRSVNANARVLFTVSPVPLAATLEPVHILQATTYSKSVLRVAAEEMRNKYAFVDYVPSYEVVTATYRNAEYFENDRRSVAQIAVDRVMKLFLSYFATHKSETTVSTFEDPSTTDLLGRKTNRECDEDILAIQIDQDISRFGF